MKKRKTYNSVEEMVVDMDIDPSHKLEIIKSMNSLSQRIKRKFLVYKCKFYELLEKVKNK